MYNAIAEKQVSHIAWFRDADLIITSLCLYDSVVITLNALVPGFKESDLCKVFILRCVADTDFTQFDRKAALKINNTNVWITGG